MRGWDWAKGCSEWDDGNGLWGKGWGDGTGQRDAGRGMMGRDCGRKRDEGMGLSKRMQGGG